MYDEDHFTHDAATATFDSDAPGIKESEDGPQFNWDDVEVVRIDNPPHANAFDTEEFYKLPATVARPIAQPYQYGEDTVWLKKPREELKRSAWSLDNAPWTMGHPETGMVKNVDDVRGFWRNPRYIDSLDNLKSDLHIPVGDDDAKQFIEENGDVSVGFYNRIARTDEYDGVVGGEDDGSAEIDGYQTDMLFDHCASVGMGRCPSSQGCGLDEGRSDTEGCGLDQSPNHGHMDEAFISDTRITGSSDGNKGPDSITTDGGTHEGTYYAVGPSENPDDEWKFPIETCSDVSDAWQLRNHGDISIPVEDLESRIERRARELDCEVPGESEDSLDGIQVAIDRYNISSTEHMTEETEDCGGNAMNIDFDDLSADAALDKVASKHDGVQERLDELEQLEAKAEAADAAAEEIDAEVDDLAGAVGTLVERRDELSSRIDELEKPQKEEHAEYITERTDKFGDKEDLLDLDLDELESKRELVEELIGDEDGTTVTANADSDGGGEPTDFQREGKYAKTPW